MTHTSSDATVELMQQFEALEYILLGDLRDILEETPDEETCCWLVAVLDALLEMLPRELELQEQEGYLAEVLEEYPNWSDQVDRLHTERVALFGKLRELRMRIAEQHNFSVIAGELRSDLRDWMQSLTAHHRHERRIVQTAFNLDVGIGD